MSKTFNKNNVITPKLDTQTADYKKYQKYINADPREMLNINNNRYYKYFNTTGQQGFDLAHENSYLAVISSSSKYISLALSCDDIENNISRYLSAKFNISSNNWDKIIDDKYISTHIGGPSLHHNLDGNHTFWGAHQALSQAYPNDLEFQRILQIADHFSRDLCTPSGINPLLSPAYFSQIKEAMHNHFGISYGKINDLLNINAAECIAAAVGLFGLMLDFNGTETAKLGEYSSRFLSQGYYSGNPLLILFSVAILARAFFLYLKGDSAIPLVVGITQGVTEVYTFYNVYNLISAMALCPGIHLIALLAASAVCQLIGTAFSIALSALKDDFQEILEMTFPNFKPYKL